MKHANPRRWLLAILTAVLLPVAAMPEALSAMATTVSSKTIYTTDNIVYGPFKTASTTAKGSYEGTNSVYSLGAMQVGIVNQNYGNMGYVNVHIGTKQTRDTTMNLSQGNAYAVMLSGQRQVVGSGKAFIP